MFYYYKYQNYKKKFTNFKNQAKKFEIKKLKDDYFV